MTSPQSLNFSRKCKKQRGGPLKLMIFDHFEERFFIQNNEISDFTNFGGMGTGDRGPGTGDRGPGTGDRGPRTGDRGPGTGTRDRNQGRGQSQRSSPLTSPRSLNFSRKCKKQRGGTFETDDFRSF